MLLFALMSCDSDNGEQIYLFTGLEEYQDLTLTKTEEGLEETMLPLGDKDINDAAFYHYENFDDDGILDLQKITVEGEEVTIEFVDDAGNSETIMLTQDQFDENPFFSNFEKEGDDYEFDLCFYIAIQPPYTDIYSEINCLEGADIFDYLSNYFENEREAAVGDTLALSILKARYILQ